MIRGLIAEGVELLESEDSSGRAEYPWKAAGSAPRGAQAVLKAKKAAVMKRLARERRSFGTGNSVLPSKHPDALKLGAKTK